MDFILVEMESRLPVPLRQHILISVVDLYPKERTLCPPHTKSAVCGGQTTSGDAVVWARAQQLSPPNTHTHTESQTHTHTHTHHLPTFISLMCVRACCVCIYISERGRRKYSLAFVFFFFLISRSYFWTIVVWKHSWLFVVEKKNLLDIYRALMWGDRKWAQDCGTVTVSVLLDSSRLNSTHARRVCPCVCEGESMCVCLCVCMWEWESMLVCVWVRDTGVCIWEREGGWVCVCEREYQGVKGCTPVSPYLHAWACVDVYRPQALQVVSKKRKKNKLPYLCQDCHRAVKPSCQEKCRTDVYRLVRMSYFFPLTGKDFDYLPSSVKPECVYVLQSLSCLCVNLRNKSEHFFSSCCSILVLCLSNNNNG